MIQGSFTLPMPFNSLNQLGLTAVASGCDLEQLRAPHS